MILKIETDNGITYGSSLENINVYQNITIKPKEQGGVPEYITKTGMSLGTEPTVVEESKKLPPKFVAVTGYNTNTKQNYLYVFNCPAYLLNDNGRTVDRI